MDDGQISHVIMLLVWEYSTPSFRGNQNFSIYLIGISLARENTLHGGKCECAIYIYVCVPPFFNVICIPDDYSAQLGREQFFISYPTSNVSAHVPYWKKIGTHIATLPNTLSSAQHRAHRRKWSLEETTVHTKCVHIHFLKICHSPLLKNFLYAHRQNCWLPLLI